MKRRKSEQSHVGDTELDKALRLLRVPKRSQHYWDRLAKRITKQLPDPDQHSSEHDPDKDRDEMSFDSPCPESRKSIDESSEIHG